MNTFIILTSDRCGHCKKFKENINNNGRTNMEEVIYSLNKYYPYLSIKKINLDTENNVDASSDDLGKYKELFFNIQGKWYPSFYIFKNDGKKYILGGMIIDGKAEMDGSSASPNPTNVFKWTQKIMGTNNTNSVVSTNVPSNMNQTNKSIKNEVQNYTMPGFLDYTYRLNGLNK